MIEQLLRNYRIKNILAFMFGLLVLVSSLTNSYMNYKTNKDVLYKAIDKTLKSAALNAEFVLGEDFFDKAINKDSITTKDDLKNISKLSKIANISEVAYIYTMFQKDTKIYFTSSSVTEEDVKKDKVTRYFDIYDEATPLLLNLLKNNKIAYEESTDEWGTFRTVLIPRKTNKGTPYILGADIKIDFIQQELDKFVENIIITQLGIICLLMILAFYFFKISKRELDNISHVKQKLDAEIEEKTRQLAQLNSSLEQRVKDEVLKNRKKDQHLIEHSRLIQMGEIVSMIAHQWRQPLTAISAANILIELKIRNKNPDIEVIKKSTTNITKYVKHLSSTIDDFRDFFKPQKDMKETNFSLIIEKVLSLNECSIKSNNIDIKIKNISTKNFLAYENELVQVVMNMFKNSEDAFKSKEIQDPEIIIIIENDTLTIEDNAGGIDEDIIGNIFDPYFSTKGKNGTGLGLYMSKLIIQEHCHGEIFVENVDNGAKFTIVMPTI